MCNPILLRINLSAQACNCSSSQRFATAFSCSVVLFAVMFDDGAATDSDDFPFPDCDHEANDDSSDSQDLMEAPIKSRRVSNSFLWGDAEDVSTPENTAATSSPALTSHVKFFEGGIRMKRLFEDVMMDTTSDSGGATSSSYMPQTTACFKGVESWHPNKIFVAVVEFAGPRWAIIINQHVKVVGKTLDVKKYLLELQAQPLRASTCVVNAGSRQKGFRCMVKWVARFSGLNNLELRRSLQVAWRSYDDEIKARWILLEEVLSIPRVRRFFPDDPYRLNGNLPHVQDAVDTVARDPPATSLCWGYLATYNTKIGLHDPQVISWVNEGLMGDELCQRLREHPLYRQNFNRFVAFQKDLAVKMGFRSVAIAMEHSSHASNPARVHLHAYAGVDIRGGIDFMGMARMSALNRTSLNWEGGAVPFVKLTIVRRKTPAAIFHAVSTGVYYVVGGKSGNMFKDTSLVPIQDCDSLHESTSRGVCVMGVLLISLVEGRTCSFGRQHNLGYDQIYLIICSLPHFLVGLA
jgi:hypothetical protein